MTSLVMIKFHFGKYKDKTPEVVLKEIGGEQYLKWLIDPATKFNFAGEKGKELKNAIYKALGIEIKPTKKPEEINVKDIIERYTDRIRTIKDLEGIF